MLFPVMKKKVNQIKTECYKERIKHTIPTHHMSLADFLWSVSVFTVSGPCTFNTQVSFKKHYLKKNHQRLFVPILRNSSFLDCHVNLHCIMTVTEKMD